MSKILKNQTVSDIIIDDMGITIPASSNYTILASEYTRWAGSSDIVTEVGSGDILVNDGSEDLSISDGIDLIKGIFQKNRLIGDTDGTLIGNVEDALKVSGEFSSGEDGLEVKPTQSHQVDFNKMVCLLDELVRQMRILNTHMIVITDLEDLEEEPGDHPIV